MGEGRLGGVGWVGRVQLRVEEGPGQPDEVEAGARAEGQPAAAAERGLGRVGGDGDAAGQGGGGGEAAAADEAAGGLMADMCICVCARVGGWVGGCVRGWVRGCACVSQLNNK